MHNLWLKCEISLPSNRMKAARRNFVRIAEQSVASATVVHFEVVKMVIFDTAMYSVYSLVKPMLRNRCAAAHHCIVVCEAMLDVLLC